MLSWLVSCAIFISLFSDSPEVQILVGRGVVDWQADAIVAFHHSVAISPAFSVVLHQRRGMASAAPKRQPRLSSFIRAYGNVSFK